MGWSSVNKMRGESISDFMRSQVLKWKNSDQERIHYNVLDIAIVNLSECYAAVEQRDTKTGHVEVFAAVVKFHLTPKSHFNLTYKSMTEHEGPNISNCPERILEKLTSTDSEGAKQWRQRCADKIKTSKDFSIKTGDKVVFNQPISFQNGCSEKSFKVYSITGKRITLQADSEFNSFLAILSRDFIKDRFRSSGLSVYHGSSELLRSSSKPKI